MSVAFIVSIHAPREGCDLNGWDYTLEGIKFQFTHPGRGATVELLLEAVTTLVSIHAPREGCDGSKL